MKILTPAQTRLLEEQEVLAGTSADNLMERAGRGASQLIQKEYPSVRSVHVCVGKGNNGGDGLIVARELALVGRLVQVWLACSPHELSSLGKAKLIELEQRVPLVSVKPLASLGMIQSDELLIDALLGIGGQGNLRGDLARQIAEINRARRCNYFRTVALDCPSGLHSLSRPLEESSAGEDQAIVADLTISIGYGKDFLFRENLAHWVGRILIARIFELEPPVGTKSEAIVPWEVRPALPRRPASVHKNNLGRVLLIAGSPGLTGAPRLAGEAALRAGAGLLTIGVRSQIYSIIAVAAPSEAMVFDLGDETLFESALEKASVVAMGPGLGLDEPAEQLLHRVMKRCDVPLLLDADALTLVAQDLSLLNTKSSLLHDLNPTLGRPPIILTPHPGEMRRLLGRDFPVEERESVARDFARTHGVYLILKGTRTIVANPEGQLWINTTGNPGLACGGSGDTLLGILAALVGQGVACAEAIKLAVWWHGRAADLALLVRGCEEGLPVAEVLRCLPEALIEVHQ